MPVRNDDPRRFLHPETIARISRLDLRGRGRRLHLRHAPQPVLRPFGRVRAAPRVHRRRRHPPSRLEGLVEDRPLLHQAVRGRDQPALHAGRRCQRVDALRPRPAEQVRTMAAPLPPASAICCCDSRIRSAALPSIPASARWSPAAQPANPHRRDRQRHARQQAAREDRHLSNPSPRHRDRLQPRHDRHRLRPADRPRAALQGPGDAAAPQARCPGLPRHGR